MTVRGWFRTWLASRERQQQRNGYDWTAGQLLRGAGPALVEAQIPTDLSDSFDRGVLEALRDWQIRKPGKS